MARYRDQAGRPIVVVTGMGVVTSLGIGTADNWRKLIAGESGIHAITRFATDGLKTRIAGTIDFVPIERAELARAVASGSPRWRPRRRSRDAGIGARGDFPGPLFLAVAADRARMAAAAGGDRRGLRRQRHGQQPRSDARRATPDAFDGFYRALHVRLGRRRRWPSASAPRARRSRCRPPAPRARPRSSSASRRSGAARRDAALCIGTDGSVNPESLIRFSLLSALSTSNDPPQAAAKPFSKNRDGFVMAEGAAALVLESLEHALARGAKILGVIEGCGEMAELASTAPARAPTAGRSSAASATRSPMPASRPTTSTTSIRTAPARRRTTRWKASPPPRCSASAPSSVPISSNKSMIGHTLSAAGAVEAVITLMTLDRQRPAADHQLPGAGSGAAARRGAERGARRQGAPRALQFLRLRRPERLAGARPESRRDRRRACRLPCARSPSSPTASSSSSSLPPPPPPAAGEVQIRGQGGGAQPHRRLGLARHGVRQAQAAAGGRRRGGRRDRGGRAGRRPRFKPGEPVVMYGALTCGICKACREGRDNLCENIAGIMGFHVDGFARDLLNMPARLVMPVPAGVAMRDAACAPIAFSTVAAHAVRQCQARSRARPCWCMPAARASAPPRSRWRRRSAPPSSPPSATTPRRRRPRRSAPTT